MNEGVLLEFAGMLSKELEHRDGEYRDAIQHYKKLFKTDNPDWDEKQVLTEAHLAAFRLNIHKITPLVEELQGVKTDNE